MSAANKYELMTFGARELVRFAATTGNTIVYSYDMTNRTVRNAILKSIDLFEENALTYQLATELNGTENVSRSLIYVDFAHMFSAGNPAQKKAGEDAPEEAEAEKPDKLTNDEKMRILFKDGMTLHFADGKNITYIPFDKSASMARNNRITFINQKLKKKMDRRLMLDIPHNKITTNLSKFYAYRGLYLTAAQRVQTDEELVLDADTVIVIKDQFTLVRNQLLITAVPDANNPDSWVLTRQKEGDVTVNAFDGEGLISPRYAQLINRKLMPNTQDATSFQIRMPFSKGVLHQVDFHEFAGEFATEETDEIFVVDMFGIPRSLNKAQIILTESMFKCCKWLATFTGRKDPMAHYFEKFREYDHGLYIANTDLNLASRGSVKLNYQFLNTLALSGENFEKLLEKQKRNINRLWLPDLKEQDNPEEAPTSKPTWELALKKNKGFLRDAKIIGMLNGIEQGMLKDCALGRIRVAGECRFISRDLLALMIHLLSCTQNPGAFRTKELKKSILRQDRFYLPMPTIRLDPQKFYGILRNPHLSREEQAALKPYIPGKEATNIYRKYFSHLRGVVMVAFKSLVPMTLSGCDFDGDLVKIISEPLVTQAIMSTVYASENKTRVLPTIDIPPVESTGTTVPETVDYDTVKNTFSNCVGYISNLAIQIGRREYAPAATEQQYQGKCAECTILTGLEIDAAKTGRHPDLQSIELPECGRDYFLDTKEKIEQMSLKRELVFTVMGEGDQTEIHVSYKGAKQPFLKIKEIPANFTGANIDRLPYWFVKQLQQKAENPPEIRLPQELPHCFDFQDTEDWADHMDEDKLRNLYELICAYKKLTHFASTVHRVKEKYKNTRYAACIYNLLLIRYDSLDAELTSGCTVQKALDGAYMLLDTRLADVKTATNALKTIANKPWAFVEPPQRKAVLAQILGVQEDAIAPEVAQLLCDFNCSGYKLLYYMTKAVICQNGEVLAKQLIQEDNVPEGKGFEKHYTQMMDIYQQALENKQTRKVWEHKLIDMCRMAIGDIFFNDFHNAVMYAHKLRGSIDKTGTFFWSVFNSEEILAHVHPAKENGDKEYDK